MNIGHVSIQTLGEMLPVFQAIYPHDVYLDLTDREKFTAVVQAKGFHLNVTIGDPIPPGSMAADILATGEPTFVHATRETTIFGFPYIARAIPLLSGGEIAGTMSIAMDVNNIEQMDELSRHLIQYLEQTNREVGLLSQETDELAKTAQTMIGQGEKTKCEAEKMLASISEVLKLAQQSHILSINTSIEAARLGEEGRSFLVISQYMQNMANHSLESGKAINIGLAQFQTDLDATLKALLEISQALGKQAENVLQLADAGKEIGIMAENMKKITLFDFNK